MAFDTVIDKAQLEAAMKATADAIREKTGDTANCTWDPAQGFAELIAAIESGGSGGGNFAHGSFILSDNSTKSTITHNFGSIPTFYLVYGENVTYAEDVMALKGAIAYIPDVTDYHTYMGVALYFNEGNSNSKTSTPYSKGYRITEDIMAVASIAKTPWVCNVNKEKCTFHGLYSTGYHKNFIAGEEYKWIVGVI